MQHQVAMERYVNSYLALHLLRVNSVIPYGLAQAKSHLLEFPYLYHSYLICLICICHRVLSCPSFAARRSSAGLSRRPFPRSTHAKLPRSTCHQPFNAWIWKWGSLQPSGPCHTCKMCHVYAVVFNKNRITAASPENKLVTVLNLIMSDICIIYLYMFFIISYAF